jgi:asparagine synthase (glutamine-hydrolysing)
VAAQRPPHRTAAHPRTPLQHRHPSQHVHRLTASTTATATHGGGIKIEHPEARPRVSQRRYLRPGVDPIAAFDRIIKTAMASYVPDNSGTVGVELSGGVDSANVALSARGLLADTPLYSIGLTLPAPAEDRLTFRRLAFAVHLNLTDTAIPAQAHLPFNPSGRRFARPHDPASSYYCEAFDVAAQSAAARGVKVMLTGFGADEVMHVPGPTPPTAPHRPAWLGPRALDALDHVNDGVSPPTAVSAPTLMACASHSPAYLREGIWPVAPFANPAVSRFARQLPIEWAQDKRLLRQRLIRAGIPRLAVRPQEGEDFASVMQLGLRTYVLPLLDKLAGELILADLGFIAPGPLRDALTHARQTPEADSALIDLLRLELGLRSLWHRAPTPSAVSTPGHTEHRHDHTDSERPTDAAALA